MLRHDVMAGMGRMERMEKTRRDKIRQFLYNHSANS